MRFYVPTHYAGSIGIECDECGTVVTVNRWDGGPRRCSLCGKLMPTHSAVMKDSLKDIQARRPDLKSLTDKLQASLNCTDDREVYGAGLENQ